MVLVCGDVVGWYSTFCPAASNVPCDYKYLYPKRRQARAEVRAQRDARFAAQQDSLIKSQNYQFLPISIYELPGGSQQMVNNVYYYLALFPDGHLEVHLPTLWGYLNPYVEVLNFDAQQVQDYQITKTQSGWSITFSAQNPEDETTYRFGI